MSPGLKRAREPYRVKNAILGISLAAFAVGVWAYSISAVKQDIFDDVDEEAEALTSAVPGTSAAAVTPSKPTTSTTIAPASAPAIPITTTPSAILNELSTKPSPAPQPRGILQLLNNRLPWLLDQQNKTLISGAPPVDNIGKISRP
ncbi:hypothetical protein CPC08DRAFT_134621 [Agrocybe pediades]|nr:hypothetical protein CPC08DRAFT_134621 [Agrocybe pediades]